MRELFRLKIASKRQVTLPQRLLNVLHLDEGDEIRLEVEDGQIAAAEACKVIPTRLFTSDVLGQLALREAEIVQGRSVPVDPQQLIQGAGPAEALPEKRVRSRERRGRQGIAAQMPAGDFEL